MKFATRQATAQGSRVIATWWIGSAQTMVGNLKICQMHLIPTTICAIPTLKLQSKVLLNVNFVTRSAIGSSIVANKPGIKNPKWW